MWQVVRMVMLVRDCRNWKTRCEFSSSSVAVGSSRRRSCVGFCRAMSRERIWRCPPERRYVAVCGLMLNLCRILG